LLVFVTAYEQFAVAAFSHAAVDYVLKPVERLRLHQTVQRLKQRLAERASGLAEFGAGSEMERLAARMRRLLVGELSTGAPPASAPEPLRVIRAGVGDTVRMIRLADVIYLQATDKYVNVVATDGEALIREPLRDLLPRLDAEQFAQVHRSTVVNLDFVQSASRDESRKLWLKLRERDERLAVSRLHAHLFKPM
jgi:DNA-binding LytR/AlgR family response regulator